MKNNGVFLSVDETAKKLDAVSPTFCTAKWLQPTLNLHTGVVSSCCLAAAAAIDPSGVEEDPLRLVNPESEIKERQNLLDGKVTKSCVYCINSGAFENSEPSERIFKSAAPWGHQEIDRILKAGADKQVIPSYLEVSFSNECQLKCLYCEAAISSAIMRETKKYGPLPTYNSNNSEWSWKKRKLTFFDIESNPYTKAFWNMLPKVSQSLYTLRITGGEPLLSTDTYRVMNYFLETPHPHLDFVVNTNLMVGQEYIATFCDQLREMENKNSVKSVSIITSVDTFGKDAEFIRNGLNWEKFNSNLKRILIDFPNVKVNITMTLNLFSLFSFDKLIHHIEELKSLRETNQLTISAYPLLFPSHFALTILGEEFRDKVETILKALENSKLEDHEKIMIKDALANFGKYTGAPKIVAMNEAQFYWYFEELKIRRNYDVALSFPELADFYFKCEKSGSEVIEYYLKNEPKDSFDFLREKYLFLKVMKAKPKQFIKIFHDLMGKDIDIDQFLDMKISQLKKIIYFMKELSKTES